MNPKHTLKDYADALTRAGLLTASTLTPAAEGTAIDCLSYDTRSLHGASLFLCKGAHFKAEYLSAALAQGAAAYVAEKPYPADAPYLLVSDIRYAMVVLGQLFYDHVTDKLTSVGITGTKGKSTTAYYVRSILNDWLTSEGKPPCAILSSIDNYDGVITEESHITTPEVLELYQHFQNAYDSGISHLVMEVSSQALKVGRVRGMTFDVGAFLNIGTDHISPIEHPDFADYYVSKLKLFDSCRVGCVNTDADHAAETVAHARSSGCELITFVPTGCTSPCARRGTTVNFPSRCRVCSTYPTRSRRWRSLWRSACRRNLSARVCARRGRTDGCRSTRAATKG